MNSEIKNELEISDIMTAINPTSSKNECADIGKAWVKTCPKCGKGQIYSSWNSLRFAIRKNTFCNICRGLERQKYPDKTRKCPNCNILISYKSRKGFVLALRNNSPCHSCWCIEREKNKDKSLYRRPEILLKISESLKKVRQDETKYGESFKEKCRKNRARQLQEGISGEVNYNPEACVFIDKINQERGWNLIHALNGGEKMVEGFFLDGYDDDRKIVFEYDEPKHHTLGQIKRDKMKEAVVKKHLSPSQFWRYDEKTKCLRNILSQKENI